MLNLTVPALIRIREGITVNLSLSVSQAVERDVLQWRIKDDVQQKIDSGSLNRSLTREDYEEDGKTDTVTFWFIDGKQLTYRVNHEITSEEFDRISEDLEALNYERKPSNNKVSKKA